MNTDSKDGKLIQTKTVDIEKLSSPKIDKLGRAYAIRRKTSVSRVWIKYGKNQIIVNGKKSSEYFKRKF